MINAPTRKDVKKFTAKGMGDWEQFVLECQTFYAFQRAYFDGPDTRKVLEAVCHLDGRLKLRWNQYSNTLTEPPTWSLFVVWLQRQVEDPAKANRTAEETYMKLMQGPNQSVQDFASQLQSIANRLREPYTPSQRKTHLYHKVVTEVKREFDKYAVSMEVLDWDDLVTKLATAEENLPDRQRRIKNRAGGTAGNATSAGSNDSNDASGQNSSQPRRNRGQKRKFSDKGDRKEAKDWKASSSSTRFCTFHGSKTHNTEDCREAKNPKN